MSKRRVAIALAVACLAAVAVAFKTAQSPHDNHRIAKNVFRAAHAMPKVGEPGDETAEALNAAEQYAQARMAPGLVLPGAYSAAFTALNALPVISGTWTEVTNRPYDSDDPRYRDPFYSNSSGGAGLVSGRVTGLAVIGTSIYAGGADGGVFRSTDGGSTWVPLTDGLPTLSVGDLRAGARRRALAGDR